MPLVKVCKKKEPAHPCDGALPCDPNLKVTGDCEKPFICLEKLKNPAHEQEITRCQPGYSINVKTCVQKDPDHPCDGLVPCSLKGPSRNCQDPVLCEHRLKNPEVPPKPITEDCDPTR